MSTVTVDDGIVEALATHARGLYSAFEPKPASAHGSCGPVDQDRRRARADILRHVAEMMDGTRDGRLTLTIDADKNVTGGGISWAFRYLPESVWASERVEP